MSAFSRLSAVVGGRSREERLRIAAMAGLFFIVLVSVGIVRPLKNALALEGLGATRFYRVYFIAAIVVLSVPLLNHLARRVESKVLIPGLAFFFAFDLVVFRIFYHAGSAAFGMIFYAWYDLFSAALVTQFFAATQLFFDASQAKSAYPMVIAVGSVGATLGGATTGFLAERIGTPQLLLVAAAVIVVFGLGLGLVWRSEERVAPKGARRGEATASFGEFRRVFSNHHVQLLATMVLLTILVKQIVDFEFNAVTRQVFGTVNAVSAFQGKFNAVTQWLPLVVLLALRPLLPRMGIGLAVFLLPLTMLAASVGLVLFWGLWAAAAAKGTDAAFRYSAERTGREILYVPIPDEIKIKAKLYIDMAIEKGLGKVVAGLVIMAALTVLDLRQVPLVALGIAAAWLLVAIRVRREYVRSLIAAVRGRFASVDGLSASLTDASTLPVVRQALEEGDDLQVAFALDLIGRSAEEDLTHFADSLVRLLRHPSEVIRGRALALLAAVPATADAVAARDLLRDPSPEVRRLAAGVLVRRAGTDRERVVDDLLSSRDAATRLATLSWLSIDPTSGAGEGTVSTPGQPATRVDAVLGQDALHRLMRRHLDRLDDGPEATRRDQRGRMELALAAGGLAGDPDAPRLLEPLIADPDPAVRAAAIRGAGRLGLLEFAPRLVDALADAASRPAARHALACLGDPTVPLLVARIADDAVCVLVRRHLPAVLARIPTQASCNALLASYAAPETDQLLDHRTLKALNKLHARCPSLTLDDERVRKCLAREVEAVRRYETASGRLRGRMAGPCGALLLRTLHEARRLRRECAFRCLALRYPANVVHRCYLALSTGDRRARGNARELLEQTIGREWLRRLGTAIDADGTGPNPVSPGARLEAPGRTRRVGTASAPDTGTVDVDAGLAALSSDKDQWVARCARAARREATGSGPEEDMDVIEKVFLLQRVDILREARASQLGLLAQLAEEIDVDSGQDLLREGEPPDALYVIIRGCVTLLGSGQEMPLRDGSAFGTWALIDDSPSLVRAFSTESTRLLRVGRAEFHDLVSDHPELGLDLLQGLARRVRALAGA